MTPTLYTELQTLATSVVDYIARLDGESDTFQIDGDTLSVVIEYKADVDETAGDRWTAPSWGISRETVIVEGVYDENGDNDTEAAAWLAKLLN